MSPETLNLLFVFSFAQRHTGPQRTKFRTVSGDPPHSHRNLVRSASMDTF